MSEKESQECNNEKKLKQHKMSNIIYYVYRNNEKKLKLRRGPSRYSATSCNNEKKLKPLSHLYRIHLNK